MSSIEDPSSARVEREAESERAGLVNTLDKLRENLKPGNVVDEVMASAKVTTSDLTDKIWRTARENPIPAILIGLGAAMLLGVGQRVKSHAAAKDHDWTDNRQFPVSPDAVSSTRPPLRPVSTRPAGTASSALSAAGEAANSVKDRITGQLDGIGSRASSAASKISDSVSDLRRQAKSKLTVYTSSARGGIGSVSGDTMNQYSRSRDQLTSSISKLLDEQPLVLAALGVAVGAAIGAAIPSTETESQLMGEASESVKQAAQNLAQDQYAHLKSTAGQTLDEIKQTASEHGVSTDNLSGLVEDVGGKVRDAAYEVGGHVAQTAPGTV